LPVIVVHLADKEEVKEAEEIEEVKENRRGKRIPAEWTKKNEAAAPLRVE
jgi:hypothetical protein